MFEILSRPVDGQKISTAPDRCHCVLTRTTVHELSAAGFEAGETSSKAEA